jgi:hypothetical protein
MGLPAPRGQERGWPATPARVTLAEPTPSVLGMLLPLMPPKRDPRLSIRVIRVIRVMFYTPGFLALLTASC